MNKLNLTIFTILFISTINGQNPLQTVKDNGNFLGKRFETSLDNFINILQLDIDVFTKYSKELGFDTRPAENFCIQVFPQANTSMSILTRCSGSTFYAYSNSKENVSTLSDLFNKLSKQVTGYADGDFTVFKIEYKGGNYKIKLKSKEEYGSLREVIIIDKI